MSKGKIDRIDAIIIRRLLLDARTSLTDLAKECKITVAAVRVRYNNLRKEGIIIGERSLINAFGLGYKILALFLIKTDKGVEKKAQESLQKLMDTAVFEAPYGVSTYNLQAQLAFRDTEELARVQRAVEANRLVNYSDVLIWSDETFFDHPENLVIKPLKETIKPIVRKQTVVKIDAADMKIAKMIAEHARMPFSRIAKEAGISSRNTKERYKKLKGNVFSLSTIRVNLQKLGYPIGTVVFMKLLNKGELGKSETELLNMPNVITLIEYSGAYDLFVYVACEGINEYFNVIETLSRMRNVDRFDAHPMPGFTDWPSNVFAYLLA